MNDDTRFTTTPAGRLVACALSVTYARERLAEIVRTTGGGTNARIPTDALRLDAAWRNYDDALLRAHGRS